MAYTPVPNAATGDKFTAAYVNAYLRDNFAAAVPDILTAKGQLAAATAADAAAPVTAPTVNGQILTADSAQATGMAWKMPTDNQVIDAKGDIFIGVGDNVMARKPVGSNGDILIADSAATYGARWWYPERVIASNSAKQFIYNQASPTAAEVQLTFDTATLDNKGSFASSTFTAKAAGKFFVRLSGRFYKVVDTGNMFKDLYLCIKKGGTTYSMVDYRDGNQWSAQYIWLGGCDIIDVAIGDALTFYVYYNCSIAEAAHYFDQHFLQITQIP